jgi:hypothetical protein
MVVSVRAHVVAAVLVAVLIVVSSVCLCGGWGVAFLLAFLPAYVRRMRREIAATRARRAAQVSARIAVLERELGMR